MSLASIYQRFQKVGQNVPLYLNASCLTPPQAGTRHQRCPTQYPATRWASRPRTAAAAASSQIGICVRIISSCGTIPSKHERFE